MTKHVADCSFLGELCLCRGLSGPGLTQISPLSSKEISECELRARCKPSLERWFGGSHPGIVWLRKTLDPRETPTEVDFRRKTNVELRRRDLKQLNNGVIKLTDKKCKDLQYLCRFLSPRGKCYYNTILSS